MTKQLIAPGSTFTFTITADLSGLRLDKFLTTQFPLYSRSFIQTMICQGLVTLNGKIVAKPSITLKAHDLLGLCTPQTTAQPLHAETLSAAQAPVIIYEHEHFLILNKPAGLVMHKPNATATEPSVADWLLQQYRDIKNVGAIDRPGIIHRLDKNTSGVLIVARTNYGHSTLSNAFMNRTVSKTYHALVHGHPDAQGTIDYPIGRALNFRARMTAFAPTSSMLTQVKTRSAITQYKVLEYFDDCALVEAKPITGRTHQIRAHFAAIGHPLLGDALYDGPTQLIKRHALHAHSIQFSFENSPYCFTAATPEDFQKILHFFQNKKR